ncbi:MAG: sigma-70 family RNA polymerase sigma factor [Verrucomicrobiota bacterium]
MTDRPDEFIPTRQSLLSRLRSWDDQESWSVFFNTYGRLIYDVARKAGLRDGEAQDVVQETIISVARELPQFKYDPRLGSFKSWLRQIARRRIVDHFRRSPKEVLFSQGPATGDTTHTAAEPDYQCERGTPFEEVWEAEWERHLMHTALQRVREQVTPRQFQIFDYYVLQEMPLAKVTKALGINAAQAYLAKHRVGRLLKRELLKLDRQM